MKKFVPDKIFWFFIVLFSLKNINAKTIQETQHQCKLITEVLCQNYGYNLTIMPNIARNVDMDDANLLFSSLNQLIASDCSQHLNFLICTSIYPLCLPKILKPVTACRSLCISVKKDCSLLAGALWPEFIDCEIFPQPEKHDLCVQTPSIVEKKNKSSNHHQTTLHSSIWQTLALWKLTQATQFNNKNISLSKCPKNFVLTEFGTCQVPCSSNDGFNYSMASKNFFENCLIFFASVSFSFTLFSLINFWMEIFASQLKFPDRAIFYLTFCYNLLSIIYLCIKSYQKPTLIDGILYSKLGNMYCAPDAQCVVFFLITNYLILCSCSWWLIFGISYFLSTSRRLSSEVLTGSLDTLKFHLVWWISCSFAPISSMLFGKIIKNEISDICTSTVENSNWIPIIRYILLLLGVLFSGIWVVSKIKWTSYQNKIVFPLPKTTTLNTSFSPSVQKGYLDGGLKLDKNLLKNKKTFI